MPRPAWKGKPTLNTFYKALVEKELYAEKDIAVKLYRRNMFITAQTKIPDLRLMIYNGYDFFDKELTPDNSSRNISGTVLTREVNVAHKAKLSKNAKKNLQLKNNKKKLSAPTKNKIIKNKK